MDEGISFADLKGTLETFARAMFGSERQVRLNPDYFPFVEPGAQVAVSCFICGGVGCRTCGNGWIELLGPGMVHPTVLENCGYDSERFTGFAFGLGIERVAMIQYGDPGHAAVRRGGRAVPRAVPGCRVKIVRSWLLECCPVDLSAEELAELLTAKGAEVERIERPWEGLDGVVVAKVLEVRDHPNSDKLCLARVSTGSGEREVVVGVRNMSPGDLVPLAGPGAHVPVLPTALTAREIRGVVSEGMLCSPMELGIAPTHEGILLLGDAFAPGDDLKSALGLDDAVLDVEVTPNRGDFLSVVGVAREVSAATGVPFTMPPTEVVEDDERAEGVATVEIQDLERCPHYLARILRDVRHASSPLRVQARLTAAGMRPISAAVDATNYAMLEIGQPLHPFDLALLKGPGIVVRRASEGERMVTLDDAERILHR